MRWILPRTLEFLSAGIPVNPIDHGLTLSRMRQTGYPDGYSSDQRRVLDAFAVAYAAAVATPDQIADQGLNLDDTLCMIANSGADLGPVLRRLDSCPTEGLLPRLACSHYVTGPGWSHFWEAGPGFDAATAWYVRESLEMRMIAYWLETGNPAPLRQRAELIADDIRLRLGSSRTPDT